MRSPTPDAPRHDSPDEATRALTEQYRDATNLDARIQIYRFATGTPWQRWVFEQFVVPPRGRLLEIGCGPGTLWAENADRLPAGTRLVLSDRSPGMVREARRRLGEGGFAFVQADAQALPFGAAAYDVVIANHMVYHVPDKPRLFAEVRRVLRAGGRFYAATNGAATTTSRPDLPEMGDLLDLFDPTLRRLVPVADLASVSPSTFTLENGGEQLAPWFAEVRLRRQESDLVVPEAEPVVRYLCSGALGRVLTGDTLVAFRAFIEGQVRRHGAIRMTKAVGMFEAVR